jgi:hypothetical protein
VKPTPQGFRRLFSFRPSSLLFSHHQLHLDQPLLSQLLLLPFYPPLLEFSLPLLSLSSSFQPLISLI